MEELSEVLNDNASFNFNYEAAAIGTQGPDIFFFHKLTNPIKTKNKVGVALHNAKPAEIIEAFSSYCEFSPNLDIAKSYIYGFILHYSLDRICHPYVFAFQEKIQAKKPKEHHSTIHNRIEVSIDSYLLAQRFGINNPVDFDAAKTISLNHEIVEEIAHLISFVVSRVTQETVTEAEVIEAIEHTHKVQNLLRDKNGRFKVFLNIVDKLIAPLSGNYKLSVMVKPRDIQKAQKYANLNHKTWVSAYDSHYCSNASFVDLFEEAKTDAQQLIKGYEALSLGYLNGYELTKNKSFLTGLEVK